MLLLIIAYEYRRKRRVVTIVLKIGLRQHVGAPCSPLVEVGQRVKKGEYIAQPQGLGARIHSSAYGVVEEITDEYIAIKADEEQPDEFEPIPETDSLLEAIEFAGVVGAGGAGFPAHIKLKTDLKGGCVIANAAECEPILKHNIQYLEEKPEELVRGLKYMLEITNAEQAYIAIKPHHTKALLALGKACKNEPNVSLKYLPNMYPAGDERVIVRELLGVELQPGQLPLEAGAVISNVESIKNIVQAIENRRPVITKDVTIAGRLNDVDAVDGKVFVDVPVGMPISYYIDKCGGIKEPYGEIVIGGPFTGKHGDLDSYVTKLSGGILISNPFLQEKRKIGIIACECSAQEPRLKEIAEQMGAEVVAEERCKRMIPDKNGRYRCDLPGICPGQAETVLKLRSHGAEALLIGNCED